MEPKLSKQSAAIIAELHRSGHLLSKESVERVEEALRVSESWFLVAATVRRFVIGLAAFIAAAGAIFTYWPGGGK